MHRIAIWIWVMEYLLPLVLNNRVFMDILKNLNFISSTINIESILISDKCVISPRLWHLVYSTRISTLSWMPPISSHFHILHFIIKERRSVYSLVLLHGTNVLRLFIKRTTSMRLALQILRVIDRWLPNFIPLPFFDLILKQIIEICAALPRIPTKKV